MRRLFGTFCSGDQFSHDDEMESRWSLPTYAEWMTAIEHDEKEPSEREEDITSVNDSSQPLGGRFDEVGHLHETCDLKFVPGVSPAIDVNPISGLENVQTDTQRTETTVASTETQLTVSTMDFQSQHDAEKRPRSKSETNDELRRVRRRKAAYKVARSHHEGAWGQEINLASVDGHGTDEVEL